MLGERRCDVRVLVTGGSGFIGRHLVARLSRRHEVLAPPHRDLDLADSHAVDVWLRDHPVDAVVHAAVRPGHRNAGDLSGLLEQNLRQFFNLARRRGQFGRFVVVGSGAVYGVQRPIVRAPESCAGETVPEDEHGLSKFAEAVWLQGDPDAVELRPFGVYGPGEDYAIRFISNACCKALLKMPVTLRQDRLLSYVWVEDLAAVAESALGLGAEALPAGAYNVTPGDPVSLRAVADVVVAAAGTGSPVHVGQGGLGLEYSGDGAKLGAALPGLGFVGTEDAVTRLLEWYRQRLHTLDRAALEIDR
jgi:UDP-glucose 4-epimerase